MKLLGIGPWFMVYGGLRLLVLVTFESLNHGQPSTIQGPWVKDNARIIYGRLSMEAGYCTLFLINIGQWSGVLCPLTVVHGAWMGVHWVGGIGEE